MNKTMSALLIKFVLTLGAAWAAFTLLGNSTFTFVLLLAISGTLLNYLIGDLFILPTFGNIIASLGDGGLSILTAYILSAFIYGLRATTTGFVFFGLFVSIAEYFFHIYLLKSKEVAPNIKTQMHNRNQPTFNMEIGDEFDFNNKNKLNQNDQRDNKE
ncbi:DUF2512 family protein [Clostridiaceae bacterium 35-E11]